MCRPHLLLQSQQHLQPQLRHPVASRPPRRHALLSNHSPNRLVAHPLQQPPRASGDPWASAPPRLFPRIGPLKTCLMTKHYADPGTWRDGVGYDGGFRA
jgi:hypothetical protein